MVVPSEASVESQYTPDARTPDRATATYFDTAPAAEYNHSRVWLRTAEGIH
jgi:hypothetical protein